MKRIALVEDDSDLAFTVSLNLQREGYSITHFGRGHDAMVDMPDRLAEILVEVT